MTDPRTIPPPAPPQEAPKPPPLRRNQPQFSMRTMLIAVTTFAIVVALTQILEDDILAGALLIVFYAMMPVCLATLSFYCRGLRQTFFLGGLAGAGLIFVVGCVTLPYSGTADLMEFGMMEVVAVLCCGFTAAITRRFLERRRWHLPADSEGEKPKH